MADYDDAANARLQDSEDGIFTALVAYQDAIGDYGRDPFWLETNLPNAIQAHYALLTEEPILTSHKAALGILSELIITFCDRLELAPELINAMLEQAQAQDLHATIDDFCEALVDLFDEIFEVQNGHPQLSSLSDETVSSLCSQSANTWHVSADPMYLFHVLAEYRAMRVTSKDLNEDLPAAGEHVNAVAVQALEAEKDEHLLLYLVFKGAQPTVKENRPAEFSEAYGATRNLVERHPDSSDEERLGILKGVLILQGLDEQKAAQVAQRTFDSFQQS